MKKIITTLNAPTPIGPYNQAVLANGTLYISGQIGLYPHNMEMVKGDVKKGDGTGNGKFKISIRCRRNELQPCC